MIPLILKRAPVGDNQDDYSVLENGVKVGPHLQGSSRRRPWMWASGHSAATVKRAAHGYEPTREAAMAAFAKSWRRQLSPPAARGANRGGGYPVGEGPPYLCRTYGRGSLENPKR
jgi:hypothetical protein